LLELTGHTDLVTNLDYKCGLYPKASALPSGSAGDEMLDVIVAVSDDKTAKAFHFSAKSLSL
jgi:hypothetical protein